jgi:hypothetical protein
MSFKLLSLVVPAGLGALWYGGALGGGYERIVDRPPAEVMAAIADLDVREQPGSPGTDPSRAGGVAPLFVTEPGTDRISFLAMSGDKVAVRMTAFLEPIDGGARTRVTAAVERGDAPDDFVSPAFRSEGITSGLFALALESELDEMVAPPRLGAQACRALVERLLAEAEGSAASENPQNLRQAVGATGRTVIRLHAIEGELRRQGCDTSGGNFEAPVSMMGPAPPPSTPGVTFQPGKPMVDVRPPSERGGAAAR